MPFEIVNPDCSSGTIELDHEDDLSAAEMLARAPRGSKKRLIYDPARNVWILRWSMPDVEIYRLEVNDKLDKMKRAYVRELPGL